jgi:putative glutamine amidotransferase
MKFRKLLISCFFFLSFCFSGYAQADSIARTRLIIMHPTVLLIDYYSNLVKLKILPDTIEYIGVYHIAEAYDYSRVSAHADSVGLKIRLMPVKGSLSEKDVYAENGCTPMFQYLFRISSGIVFNGGPDIQPELYGAETSLMTGISDPVRHIFEMSFMFHLLGSARNPAFVPLLEQRPAYMILGICLGMQTMVAASGGTLIQDIPTEIYKKKTVEQVMKLASGKQHKNYYKVKYPLSEGVSFGTLHFLSVDPACDLWKNCHWEKQVQVYSFHHQAAGKLPPSLRPVAWSEDKKVIEAVSHKKYSNVLGIQFHPEPDFLYQPLKKTFLAGGDKMTIGRVIENDKATMRFLKEFWKEMMLRLR